MKRVLGLLVSLALGLGAMSCAGAGGRRISAEFVDVGDLVPRANVQQSDAVVGSIRSIDLEDRHGQWLAKVTMQVNDQATLNQGMRAIVRSTSLLGEKYVDLVAAPEGAPTLGENAVIPAANTAKAPELEQVFSQLGAILQTGALEDLAKITSASAMILEGQEDSFGRVLDGTANLIASVRAQKDALAQALDDLASASGTLAADRGTLDRALVTSDKALKIVAGQQSELDDLVVQLDKLGGPLADLTRKHQADTDSQVKSLNAIVPKLYEMRNTLDHAVKQLPPFTKRFAAAAPGDYVQLDVDIEAPVPLPVALAASTSQLQAMFLEVTK